MENQNITKCPNCEHTITSSSQFCPFCGFKLHYDSVQERIEYTYNKMAKDEAKRFRSAKPWYGFTSIICLFLGIILITIGIKSWGIGLIIFSIFLFIDIFRKRDILND